MANIIKKTTYEIDKPMQMAKMATLLKSHILKHELSVNIVNKNYVMVEGWQFAGGMMGLFPRIVKVENLGKDKWMAQAEIVNQKTDKVVSSGYAICSKEESKKSGFDEYAILSMAQTRAIGKAFRNLIGWVMKMTGYESTPAEEMKVNGKAKTTEEKVVENKAGAMLASEADKERIRKVASEIGIKKVNGLEGITKVVASRILLRLMEKKAKK